MTSAAFLTLLLQVEIPRLNDRIVDLAKVMSAQDADALRAQLADLERTDSTQVVLLTIPTTGGKSIEEFAIDAFRQNGIGQKQKNNGVLILIAVRDRKCRIEVGTGLEGRLTDALSWHIIKTEMIPEFKSERHSAGARAGVDAVIKAVRGEYKAPGESRMDGAGYALLLRFAFLMVIVAVVAAICRFRGWLWVPWALLPLWPLLGCLILWIAIAVDLFIALVFFAFWPTFLVMRIGHGGSTWIGGSSWDGGSSGSDFSGGDFSGGGGSSSGGGSSGSW